MFFKTPALYNWKFPFNFLFKFDPVLWHQRPNFRMRMVNHIIESDMAINLSKEELISIFGNGRDEAHWHLVSYDIPTPFFSIYKKKLNFYFNDKRVDRVVLKFRRKVLTKKGK